MICDSFTNSYSKAFISISYQTVLVKLLLQQVFHNLMYLLSPFQINFIVFTEDRMVISRSVSRERNEDSVKRSASRSRSRSRSRNRSRSPRRRRSYSPRRSRSRGRRFSRSRSRSRSRSDDADGYRLHIGGKLSNQDK